MLFPLLGENVFQTHMYWHIYCKMTPIIQPGVSLISLYKLFEISLFLYLSDITSGSVHLDVGFIDQFTRLPSGL